MANKTTNKGYVPLIGLFVLLLFLLLILLFSFEPKETEQELKTKLQEKKAELEVIILNIAEAKQFQDALVKDIQLTNIILRWVALGSLTIINVLFFQLLGYHLKLKDILECIAIVNSSMFTLLFVVFFLKYGEFVKVKSAYYRLQKYILTLRYGKTQEQIQTYLETQIETRQALQKEIEDIAAALRALDELNQTVVSSAEMNN